MNDAVTQSGASGAAGTSDKFRDWSGTLNCGFTGESCKLTVHGQYLAGRCGGAELEKRTFDITPTVSTIDIVDSEGGGGWIDLKGTFDAGKELAEVILQDAHGNRHKFPVQQLET